MDLKNDKKAKMTTALIAVGILGIAGLVYYLLYGLTHVTTDDAYITGRIHNIASRVPGTVQSVDVEDNQYVKEGDLLVKIDPVDYILKVNEARAVLGLKRASYEQAARDKARAQALYDEHVFSKERYENAVTARDKSRAEVKVAVEQLKIAERNLKYTDVKAPADGYVTNKSVEIGNQVQMGQPLMAIVALDDIWVVANYKETQLKNVRPGQRAVVKVDAHPGRKFYGRVDSIMAGTGAAFSLFPPENALGNYVKVVQRIPVKIVLDKDTDKDHLLCVGMSCEPTIITKNDKSQ